MFAAFTSADGSTAVKTAAALAVICKLATECLWPATSTDGVPHGGMRKLDGFLLLPIRQKIHPASTSPQQQKSQQPPTPPAPQETEDSMLGKHPRDDLSDTNDSDTSGTVATLLTTITPARQVRLVYIFFTQRHTKFEIERRLANKSGTHSQNGGSYRSGAGTNEHTERSKDRRRKYDPALHIGRTQAARTGVVGIETTPT